MAVQRKRKAASKLQHGVAEHDTHGQELGRCLRVQTGTQRLLQSLHFCETKSQWGYYSAHCAVSVTERRNNGEGNTGSTGLRDCTEHFLGRLNIIMLRSRVLRH